MKKLLLLLGLVLIMGIASASDAIAAYRSDSYVGSDCTGNDVNCPRVRFWDSDADSWGSEIVLQSSGSEVKWVVVKTSPVSDKIVIVAQSSGSSTSYDKLTGYVCMSECDDENNWEVTTNLATVSNTGCGGGGCGSEIEERMFDVEFETATGYALVVYSVYNTNDDEKDFGYKVLPAANSDFGSLTEYYIDDDSDGSDNVEHKWVRLDRDPVADSEELIMTAYNPEEYDIDAWVWNGDSWGNRKQISSTASSAQGDEALAVRYAADGSKGMVLGAYGNSGYVRYAYWNGASWSSVGSMDMEKDGGNDDVRWMNLKADPETDDLQAVMVEDGDGGVDLDTAYWNGSSWDVEDDVDDSLDTDSRRPADFEWNPTGSTGILVWDRDGESSNGLRKMTCDPKCDNSQSSTYNYYGEGRWITLYGNPSPSDDVNILGVRLNYDCYSCGFHCYMCSDALGAFSYDGSSYSNYGDGTLTWSPGSTVYECYSVDFLGVCGSTQVSVIKVEITPVVTSPGGTVQWEINVSNPGEATLSTVFVSDTLPEGFNYAGSNIAPDAYDGTVNWTIGPIASGNSIQILLNTTVDSEIEDGTYYNSVEVTGSSECGEAEVSDEDEANVGINSPGIHVTKSANDDVLYTHDNKTITLNISNTGAVDINVTVQDLLSANMKFEGASVDPTSINGQLVEWAGYVIVPVGSSTILEYNVSMNKTGNHTNDVTVTGVPPNGDNVTDEDSITITVTRRPDSDDGGNEQLSIAFSPSCEENIVTVTSHGDPVNGAEVAVTDTSPSAATIALGSTSADGIFAFSDCGRTVKIRASKSGYTTEHITQDLIPCEECVQPECIEDTDCPGDALCDDGSCVSIPCECGQLVDHECVEYDCCSDEQCDEGQICTDNVCVAEFECTSDDDCSETDYCNIPPGAAGGDCVPVSGQCGYVEEHAWVQYECGDEDGCPECAEGYTCVSHKCVIGGVECDPGMVGDETQCQASDNGEPCVRCEYTLTDPEGNTQTGTTDDEGGFGFTFEYAGIYTIALLKDGEPIGAGSVEALSRAPIEINPQPGFEFDLLWLLLILLLILAIVLWKRRKKKPAAGKKK